MSFQLVAQQRGTKVIVDTKHVKTIPSKYASSYAMCADKITHTKKRLTVSERKILTRNALYKQFLEKLATSQPHLYELIKNTVPTAARKVITPEKERLELQLDNDMKITCPSIKLFNLFPHLSDSYQNY